MAPKRDLLKNRGTLKAMEQTSLASAAASATTNVIVGVNPNTPRVLDLRLDQIERDPSQPRKVFKQSDVDSLAETIQRFGLKSPVLVRPLEDGRFRLVAGERRLRAVESLGQPSITAIVSSNDTEETALVENTQRVDLNAVELAFGLDSLSKKGYTQEELGKIVNLNRSVVSRLLRITTLPAEMIAEFNDIAASETGPVSRQTLMEIAAAATTEEQWSLWEAAKSGATSREVQEARRDTQPPPTSATPPAPLPRRPDVRRAVSLAVRRIESSVRTLAAHASAITPEDRARLEDLRREIDTALSS